MGVAKRAWMAVPAALGAVLAVVVGAPAATHPSATVHSAKLSGGSVVFTVDVSAPAKTCTGKAKLSASGHHWTGAVKKSGKACRARIRGKLPKSAYGKRVTFHFSLAGRSGTARLKLAPPAPGGPTTQPTTPTQTTTTTTTTTDTTPTQTQPPAAGPPDYVNGYWLQSSGWPTGASGVSVTVTNGRITNVDATMQVKCSNGTLPYSYHFAYQQEIGVLPDGSFSGEYDKAVSGVPGAYTHLKASGTFRSDRTGTVTLTATGYDAGYSDCAGTATGEIANST